MNRNKVSSGFYDDDMAMKNSTRPMTIPNGNSLHSNGESSAHDGIWRNRGQPAPDAAFMVHDEVVTIDDDSDDDNNNEESSPDRHRGEHERIDSDATERNESESSDVCIVEEVDEIEKLSKITSNGEFDGAKKKLTIIILYFQSNSIRRTKSARPTSHTSSCWAQAPMDEFIW